MVTAIHLCVVLCAAAPPEIDYVRRASREETRAATLARYVPDLRWSSWHLIGPFDNTGRTKHGVVYPPELEVDLEQSYRGKDGREVSWQPIAHDGRGPINLKRFGADPRTPRCRRWRRCSGG